MTTTPDLNIKTGVRDALASLQTEFHDWSFRTVPDGQGGLWVEVAEVTLGPPYDQESSWLLFLLPFGLPGVDIYPMFVRPDLARLDGAPHGPAFQSVNVAWPGDTEPRPAVQISRITKGNFAAQTSAQKVTKVLGWLKTL